MQKIVFPNAFLNEIATMLQEGQSVRVRIDGRSMYPFITGGLDEVELIPYKSGTPIPQWCCLFFKWHGHYMVHRYVGRQNEFFCMMGDGNLEQIEYVREEDIFGILQTIYHPDGSRQDCNELAWLHKGMLWYKFRKLRRYFIPLYKRFPCILRIISQKL